MGSTEEHQKLVDDILYDVGSMPEVRVWTRPVGFDFEKNITYGIPGEADIQGIVFPFGRHLHIEVKSGNAVLSKKQKARQAVMVMFGAHYIVGKNREEVRLEVAQLVALEKSKWDMICCLTQNRTRP